MYLFLDTAQTDEWQRIDGVAPIQGVTTNPTLIKQAGLTVSLSTYELLLKQAIEKQIPVLMLQLPSPLVHDGLVWVHRLTSLAQDVSLTFKMPCHTDWAQLHAAVRQTGASTLLTGVSNAMQLLWAADQRATYIAPYLGRLEQAGRNVELLIDAMAQVQHENGPKVMAASIKSADIFTYLVKRNVYACTAKPQFYRDLAQDALTNTAIEQFRIDCL